MGGDYYLGAKGTHKGGMVGLWDFSTADAGISRVFPYKRLRVSVLTGACLGKMDGMLVSIEKTYFDKAHRLLSCVSGLSIQLS